MIYTKPELVLLAECVAIELNLDAALVCALVDIESQWHAEKTEWMNSAMTAPEAMDPDEWAMRNYRWGLTQVLGAAARRAGYAGELFKLCEPEINLEWGCKVLAELLAYAGNPERALILWRGTVGGTFPAMVMARRQQYEEFLRAPGRPAKIERVKL